MNARHMKREQKPNRTEIKGIKIEQVNKKEIVAFFNARNVTAFCFLYVDHHDNG